MELCTEQITAGSNGEVDGGRNPLRFIFTTDQKLKDGSTKVNYSYIDKLPKDELVMDPYECQSLSMLLGNGSEWNQEALFVAGYAKSPSSVKPAGYTEDSISRSLNDAGRTPQLTLKGRMQLARAVMAGQQLVMVKGLADKDDESTNQAVINCAGLAWDQLVAANRLLAVSIAKKYAKVMPLEDAISEAEQGLMHAVSKYDYRKGFTFSTYAIIWIRQQLGRVYRPDYSHPLRVPTNAYQQIGRINAYEEAKGKIDGYNIEEVARDLKIEKGQLELLLGTRIALAPVVWLDAPLSSDSDMAKADSLEIMGSSIEGDDFSGNEPRKGNKSYTTSH